MYRKRSSSGISFFRIMVIGVMLGAAFFAFDRWRSSQDNAPTPSNSSVVDNAITEPISDTGDTPSEEASSQIEGFISQISNEAEIFIPSVGITASITQAYLDGTSWDVSHLGRSVGHLQGTSWVNDGPGNIVLSGHVELSDGQRGVFAELGDMRVGETIFLTENGEERRYMVVAINNVEPDDLTPLYPTEFERLTLITCGGYDFLSDEYRVRTVVIADRVS